MGRSADCPCWWNIAGRLEQLHRRGGAKHNAGIDHARIGGDAWYGNFSGKYGNPGRRDNDSAKYDSRVFFSEFDYAKHDADEPEHDTK